MGVAPKKPIRPLLLLHVLCSIRSERMLLLRWLANLAMDDAVGDHSLFIKSRDKPLAHDVIVTLFNGTVEAATAHGHLLGERSASMARRFRLGRPIGGSAGRELPRREAKRGDA